MRQTTMTIALVTALMGCGGQGETPAGPATAPATAPPTEGPTAPSGNTDPQANGAPTAAPTAPDTTALTATVGQPAPDFTLTDESGQSHHLADLRGKIVVLEWTNQTCPFVVRHYGDEHQTMKRLDAALPDDRVVWLAIDSTEDRTAAENVAWRQERGLPYPILSDPDGAVGRSYGARTTPHMFVIDAEGRLRYAGAIDDDPRGDSPAPRNLVQDAVQALLDGRDPPVTQTQPYGCSVHYAS